MSGELVGSQFWYVVLVAYWTVFLAELVGDKSIYTITSLTLRYRAVVVFGASAVAFAAKMLVAVLLGSVIVRLHSRWADGLSAAAFFLSATLIWFEEPRESAAGSAAAVHWTRAAAACFFAFFLTEWGDPGEFAAAALTVKSHSMVAPWLGGTLAMTTKGALAMTVGMKLRDRLPRRMLRTLASASCCLLGVLALSGIVFR